MNNKTFVIIPAICLVIVSYLMTVDVVGRTVGFIVGTGYWIILVSKTGGTL